MTMAQNSATAATAKASSAHIALHPFRCGLWPVPKLDTVDRHERALDFVAINRCLDIVDAEIESDVG